MKPDKTLSQKGYYETKKHTNSMFPYNVYPCTIPQDFPAVYLHWQDTMEIIYIKKGFGIAQVDFSVFEVNAGDIVFVPPGRLHGLKHKDYQPMEYENIIFDLNLLGIDHVDICSKKYLQPLQNNMLAFPHCITPTVTRYEEIAACLNDSDLLCESRCLGYELGVKGNMMRLFSLLFQIGEISSFNEYEPKKTEELKTILNLVQTQYASPISVEEAASQIGYSSSHFMRWFKNSTGTSFNQYLNEYRLGKALEELRFSKKTILEIAEQNGFTNLSNFNRLFKKHFKMTPSEMR